MATRGRQRGKRRERKSRGEFSFTFKEHEIYIGTDEAGRGCLAGSVYAAAVILNGDDSVIAEFKDSKMLTPERREELFAHITAHHRYGIGSASVEEITRWNILRASQVAMYRAFLKLRLSNEEVAKAHLLVDGHLPIPQLPIKQTPIVDGDQLVKAISATSILAKVSRDREAAIWDQKFPGYGFKEHKGYGTPFHREALSRLGPCAIHRPTFSGVAELLSVASVDRPPVTP